MTCKFDKAWQGLCGKECVGDFCEDHLGIKCRCGKQATSECSETPSLVCGVPLCGDLYCKAEHDFAEHSIFLVDSKFGCEIALISLAEYATLPKEDLLKAIAAIKQKTLTTKGLYQKNLSDRFESRLPFFKQSLLTYYFYKTFVENDLFFIPKSTEVVYEEIESENKWILGLEKEGIKKVFAFTYIEPKERFDIGDFSVEALS